MSQPDSLTAGRSRYTGIGPMGYALLAYVAGFSALTYLPGLSPATRDGLLDAGSVLPPLVVALLCLRASLVARGRERASWLFLTTAYLAAAGAEALWGYLDLSKRGPFADPSWADVSGLIFYPLAFIGILLLVRRGEGPLRRYTSTLDGLVFTLGMVGLSWELVLQPSVAAARGFLPAATGVAYFAGDLLLVFALASLFLNTESRKATSPLLYVQAGFLLTILIDLEYGWMVLEGTYQTGSLIDPLTALACALAGIGALVRARGTQGWMQSDAAVEAALTPNARRRLDTAGIGMPYLAFPAVAGFLYLHFSGNRSTDRETMLLVAFAVVVLGLVMVRQLLSLLENRRLTRSLAYLSEELEERVADRTEKLSARTHELTQKTEELSARTSQLTALNEVAVALSRCLTQDEVMQTGLRMAVRVTGCRAGVGWVKRAGSADTAWTEGVGEEAVALYRLVQAYLEREVEHRRSCRLIASSDLLAEPASLSPPAALLVVPLVSRRSVLGGLGLLVQDPTGLGNTELRLEESVGALVGVALENARQYEDARYLAERDSVTGLLNHRALHNRLERELGRARRSEGTFSLLMLDLDNFKLFNDTYGHPVGDEILRRVGSIIVEAVRDSDDVGRYGGDEFMVLLPDTGTQGAVELAERLRHLLHENPFVGLDGVGVPILASCGVATYPDDAVLLNELIGMADTNLYRSKEDGGDRITSSEGLESGELAPGSSFGVVEGLVTAVDRKDRYTRHHSEDVTEWALALAHQMGLSEESQRTLRIAGLLHDVGKIGVPDSILRKPGKLTEEEFEVVKQHALLSELIVKEVPNLQEVMAAVGSHHERFDGAGYPRRLRGADIPLLGRILAVADAYSAMTTDRPYRKAMTHEEARAELERVSGTQLDPVIVAVFLRMTRELPLLLASPEVG